MMKDLLTIRRPDDWHLHVRDGAMMRDVVPYSAHQFARAVIMPNITPPVTDMAGAVAYRERILAAAPAGPDFMPLMTCYLTDNTDVDDLVRGAEAGVFTAAKLYPAGATTNSDDGVTDLVKLDPVLARMEVEGIVLCIHGEVTDPDIDIFDREVEFIRRHLRRIVSEFPRLKVVFEHITTSDAVDFVAQAGPNIGATITPQHLHINRNDMLVDGIRPHHYCLPVAKRERHRLALRKAATSGDRSFFLGTDSAPHERYAKESACGCAGIFNAPFALESYLAVFDAEDALDKFEGFASLHGPAFYGLPVNERTIIIERAEVTVPDELNVGGSVVVPFHAGQTLGWKLAS